MESDIIFNKQPRLQKIGNITVDPGIPDIIEIDYDYKYVDLLVVGGGGSGGGNSGGGGGSGMMLYISNVETKYLLDPVQIAVAPPALFSDRGYPHTDGRNGYPTSFSFWDETLNVRVTITCPGGYCGSGTYIGGQGSASGGDGGHAPVVEIGYSTSTLDAFIEKYAPNGQFHYASNGGGAGAHSSCGSSGACNTMKGSDGTATYPGSSVGSVMDGSGGYHGGSTTDPKGPYGGGIGIKSSDSLNLPLIGRFGAPATSSGSGSRNSEESGGAGGGAVGYENGGDGGAAAPYQTAGKPGKYGAGGGGGGGQYSPGGAGGQGIICLYYHNSEND